MNLFNVLLFTNVSHSTSMDVLGAPLADQPRRGSFLVTNVAGDGYSSVQVTNPALAAVEMEREEKLKRERKFNSCTTAMQVLEGIELTGKTYLITGTTSGIGLETAKALVLKGAHVVMFNRNIRTSEVVKKSITSEMPSAKIDLITSDLSSMQSVEAAADEFLGKHWPLHGLILNAGLLLPRDSETIDGFETTFGVNHLAHFMLIKKLLPVLRQSRPSRIVIVTSTAYRHTGLKREQTTIEKLEQLCAQNRGNSYSAQYKSYAMSKMCNLLTCLKIDREESKENGISTYAVHPGTVHGTGIFARFGFISYVANYAMKLFTKTAEQGAATSVYCAAHPEVTSVSGKFWENCWDDDSSMDKSIACDEMLQDQLWDHSESLIEKWEKNRKPVSTISSI